MKQITLKVLLEKSLIFCQACFAENMVHCFPHSYLRLYEIIQHLWSLQICYFSFFGTKALTGTINNFCFVHRVILGWHLCRRLLTKTGRAIFININILTQNDCFIKTLLFTRLIWFEISKYSIEIFYGFGLSVSVVRELHKKCFFTNEQTNEMFLDKNYRLLRSSQLLILFY